MVLHHLGIACADVRETLVRLRNMLPIAGHSDVIHDPEQRADLCMISLRGSPPLELISGPMVSKLASKGISLYHSCWEVDDLDAAIARLCAASGCLLVSGPKPAVLFGGRRVSFLSGPVGLVELLSAS
jgi:methylmalonyl-CoA/ethylmalonyl-CoA epimerase